MKQVRPALGIPFPLGMALHPGILGDQVGRPFGCQRYYDARHKCNEAPAECGVSSSVPAYRMMYTGSHARGCGGGT